jgi:hypothetical protein
MVKTTSHQEQPSAIRARWHEERSAERSLVVTAHAASCCGSGATVGGIARPRRKTCGRFVFSQYTYSMLTKSTAVVVVSYFVIYLFSTR